MRTKYKNNTQSRNTTVFDHLIDNIADAGSRVVLQGGDDAQKISKSKRGVKGGGSLRKRVIFRGGRAYIFTDAVYVMCNRAEKALIKIREFFVDVSFLEKLRTVCLPNFCSFHRITVFFIILVEEDSIAVCGVVTKQSL